MKSTTYQWKLPLPNSKSHVRNILTVYTYLSFLAVYPLLIDSFLNPVLGDPQSFGIAILALVATFITILYALGATVVPKKYRKWYWILIGVLALLLTVSVFFGGFLLHLIYPLIFLIGPAALATLLMGFISPIFWVALGFRKQESSMIEAEFTTVEESKSTL